MSLPLNPNIAVFMVHDQCCKTECRSSSWWHGKVKAMSCKAQYGEEGMRTKTTNFYQLLSLGSENVSFDDIKKAYRTMALRYHPDVCPPSAKEESTRRFIELQKAYHTLSDPVLRKVHDYELGLVNSIGSLLNTEGRLSKFPRKVWETQLCGLKERSRVRTERKTKTRNVDF